MNILTRLSGQGTYLGVTLLGHDACVFSTMPSNANPCSKYGCTNLRSSRVFELPLLYSFANFFVRSHLKTFIHQEWFRVFPWERKPLPRCQLSWKSGRRLLTGRLRRLPLGPMTGVRLSGRRQRREAGSGAISGGGRHLAVRQQKRSSGMLSSVAAYSGPGRDPDMEPHSAVGPLQLRFSPYAFNGG